MADFKEWSSQYPTHQDPTPVTGLQPQLENDPTGVPPEPGQGDATRVSQIHTLRDKLQALALALGDADDLPLGCLRARVTALEGAASGEDLQHAYDHWSGVHPAILMATDKPLSLNAGTTPTKALWLDIAAPAHGGAPRDSHSVRWTGRAHDDYDNDVSYDWLAYGHITGDVAKISEWTLQFAEDNAGYATKLKVDSLGKLTLSATNVAETYVTNLLLDNPTAATELVPNQCSPVQQFSGSYWEGAASEECVYQWQIRTDSTATTLTPKDLLVLSVRHTTAWPTVVSPIVGFGSFSFGGGYDFGVQAYYMDMFISGSPVADRNGNGIAIYGGNVTSGGNRGGTIAIAGGDTDGNNGAKAGLIVYGQSPAIGGQITISAGDAGAAGGNGGYISLWGGTNEIAGTEGHVLVVGGNGAHGATSGYVLIESGFLHDTTSGGSHKVADVTIKGGDCSEGTYAITGGHVYVKGGYASGATSTSGSVYLRGGASSSGSTPGNVVLADTGGYVLIPKTNVGQTWVTGLLLDNPTVATESAPLQFSPGLSFSGSQWFEGPIEVISTTRLQGGPPSTVLEFALPAAALWLTADLVVGEETITFKTWEFSGFNVGGYGVFSYMTAHSPNNLITVAPDVPGGSGGSLQILAGNNTLGGTGGDITINAGAGNTWNGNVSIGENSTQTIYLGGSGLPNLGLRCVIIGNDSGNLQLSGDINHSMYVTDSAIDVAGKHLYIHAANATGTGNAGWLYLDPGTEVSGTEGQLVLGGNSGTTYICFNGSTRYGGYRSVFNSTTAFLDAASVFIGGVGTTTTTGFLSQNTTAATVVDQLQLSPAVKLSGSEWVSGASRAMSVYLQGGGDVYLHGLIPGFGATLRLSVHRAATEGAGDPLPTFAFGAAGTGTCGFFGLLPVTTVSGRANVTGGAGSLELYGGQSFDNYGGETSVHGGQGMDAAHHGVLALGTFHTSYVALGATATPLRLNGVVSVMPDRAPSDCFYLATVARTTQGVTDSHGMVWQGHYFPSGGGAVDHTVDWRAFNDVTSDVNGASTWKLQNRIDGVGFFTALSLTDFGQLTVPDLVKAHSGSVVIGTQYLTLGAEAAYLAAVTGGPERSLAVAGTEVDSGTAVGVRIGSSVALSSPGAKLLSICNATVEKAYFDHSGAFCLKAHSAFAGSSATATTDAVQTTTATATNLYTFALSDTFAYTLRLSITARNTDGTEHGSWIIIIACHREGGGAVLDHGGEEHLEFASSDNPAGWGYAVSTDGNNVLVDVTGENGKTINWVCDPHYQGVSGSA